MHRGKVATLLVPTQPPAQLLPYRVLIQARGSILGQAADAGLSGEPVTAFVDVEVGGVIAQFPERVTKDRGALSRLHATQFDAAVLQTARSGMEGRRRPMKMARATR